VFNRIWYYGQRHGLARPDTEVLLPWRHDALTLILGLGQIFAALLPIADKVKSSECRQLL